MTLEERKQWFRNAGFGMMIHFGLYTLLAGEWNGRRMGSTIGEWAQSYFRIPSTDYHRLAEAFNPVCFRAEDWVKAAVNAGMRYFVITAKHHEGFSLFRSKASAFNTVDATPFRRDIIEECAEACAKYGLGFGLYYSQCLDWSHPDGGGYGATHKNVADMSWCNDWDYPDNAGKDYARCFHEKILPQTEELLTRYGDLALIWFDTPFDITASQSRTLYETVRKYQPSCLVNSRIGNGFGDYTSAGDNEIPEDHKDSLFETPCTLNDTWGYKAYDDHWKSPETVENLRQALNDRRVNYLLNIGPDPLGRLPAPALDVLRTLAR